MYVAIYVHMSCCKYVHVSAFLPLDGLLFILWCIFIVMSVLKVKCNISGDLEVPGDM